MHHDRKTTRLSETLLHLTYIKGVGTLLANITVYSWMYGSDSPRMAALWRIELFGALRAQRAGQNILRFRTQKAGSLLGYMAFYLGQPHSREVLSESLWPESDVAASRHRLRMALSSLRHQL